MHSYFEIRACRRTTQAESGAADSYRAPWIITAYFRWRIYMKDGFNLNFPASTEGIQKLQRWERKRRINKQNNKYSDGTRRKRAERSARLRFTRGAEQIKKMFWLRNMMLNKGQGLPGSAVQPRPLVLHLHFQRLFFISFFRPSFWVGLLRAQRCSSYRPPLNSVFQPKAVENAEFDFTPP